MVPRDDKRQQNRQWMCRDSSLSLGCQQLERGAVLVDGKCFVIFLPLVRGLETLACQIMFLRIETIHS